MDKIVCDLIDGITILCKSYHGGSKFYWNFLKEYLSSYSTLHSFLQDNGHLTIKDFHKKTNQKSFMKLKEQYLHIRNEEDDGVLIDINELDKLIKKQSVIIPLKMLL